MSGPADAWYATADPMVAKVVHDLTVKAEQIGEIILAGQMKTFEQYQAQVQMRQFYVSMIADIREALADDNRKSDEQARSNTR